MAFTLVLLGSDVLFNPKPNRNYPRGESLSLIASLIRGSDCETNSISNTPPEHHLNQAVTVIDGPDTAGFRIGDCIARALITILDAIARGETQISIVGFSRGAVESILVSHELERIKELLNRVPFDLLNCLKSDCKKTQAALFAHKEKILALLAKIKSSEHRLNNINLALFSLDPVPGGRFFGLPTHWRDPRFYELPPIVTSYEQYVYENEHSRGFKPIIPAVYDSQKTSFKLMTVPGHHGTGSGNLGDHRGKPVPLENKTTTHVQELILVKLIDFLKRNGVLFKTEGELLSDEGLQDMLRPLLADSVDPKLFDAEYARIYSAILENMAAYKYFDKSNYPLVGFEQSISNLFGKRIVQRLIHFREHTNLFIQKALPALSRKFFLNEDHARIGISEKLNLNLNGTIPEIIESIIPKLVDVCNDYYTLNMHSEPAATSTSPLAFLLEDPESIPVLIAGIRAIFNQISAQYLEAQYSEKEKTRISNTFLKGLEAFNSAAPSSLKNQIKEELTAIYENTVLTEEEKIRKLFHEHHDLEPEEDTDPSAKKESTVYSNLIEKQLIPLTQNYLNHLIKEAAKIRPSLAGKNCKTLKNSLPEYFGERPVKLKYQKIAKKYKLAHELLSILEDGTREVSAKERIKRFARVLKQTHDQLKSHRDPVWMNYMKSCLLAIGLVCTGLIPGLIALLAYSLTQGKSFFFFSQSKGEQFKDVADKKISRLNCSM